MLVKPSIETLKNKTDSPYETAILVAQRARQLNEGAQPMVPDKAANVVSLACCEIIEDKVVAVKGKVKPVVPITREERIRREEEEKKRKLALEEKLNAQMSMDSLMEAVKAQSESEEADLFAEVSAEEADAEALKAVDDLDDEEN